MIQSVSNRFSTLWQWFGAAVVVLVLHALVVSGLDFSSSPQKPKIVSQIEVQLIDPPQTLSVPQPQPQPAKRVETPVVRPQPVRIPQPVPELPVVMAQDDTAPSKPAHVPAPDQPTSPPAVNPPAASPTESEPITAPRFNAAYLNNPPRTYPAAARRAGYEGTVLIRARIQIDGKADLVEIKKSSGYSVLDQTALEAVRQWRFVPARKGNDAVVEWVDIPWKFKLENR